MLTRAVCRLGQCERERTKRKTLRIRLDPPPPPLEKGGNLRGDGGLQPSPVSVIGSRRYRFHNVPCLPPLPGFSGGQDSVRGGRGAFFSSFFGACSHSFPAASSSTFQFMGSVPVSLPRSRDVGLTLALAFQVELPVSLQRSCTSCCRLCLIDLVLCRGAHLLREEGR